MISCGGIPAPDISQPAAVAPPRRAADDAGTSSCVLEGSGATLLSAAHSLNCRRARFN